MDVGTELKVTSQEVQSFWVTTSAWPRDLLWNQAQRALQRFPALGAIDLEEGAVGLEGRCQVLGLLQGFGWLRDQPLHVWNHSKCAVACKRPCQQGSGRLHSASLVDVGRGAKFNFQQLSGDFHLNHNKQKCKLFPNNHASHSTPSTSPTLSASRRASMRRWQKRKAASAESSSSSERWGSKPTHSRESWAHETRSSIPTFFGVYFCRGTESPPQKKNGEKGHLAAIE